MSFFFFNDTATTEIYTLSLHDALPILSIVDEQVHIPCQIHQCFIHSIVGRMLRVRGKAEGVAPHIKDRKSTRLNSSHANISYAVFCLKKKKKTNTLL